MGTVEVGRATCMCMYRVMHELWTVLQEMTSWPFLINIFYINTCPILNAYGVMAAGNLE